MRRKWIVSALIVCSLVVAAVGWQGGGPNPGKAVKGGALPIRQVALFNSGVSYIQREGEVEGTTHIDLSFPVSDINDLLKSLILSDRDGGKVSAVNYDSHDPIDKVLRSFAVDLNGNPTFSQIVNQARGEKVEIVRLDRKDGKPTQQTGIIVGMEVRKQAVKDALVDVDYLNLAGESGLQNIALDQVQSVRFLNPVLDNEFQRALRVVASSHDTQKKTVSFGFSGNGKRRVQVGYVIEHPIWKTSYRLQLEPKGKVAIQGWAIVENTSDDDWNDVDMTLVSGRPISFKMDLYQPLYVPRPTIEPELFASLRPPVYSGALEKAQDKAEKMAELQKDEKEKKSEEMPPRKQFRELAKKAGKDAGVPEEAEDLEGKSPAKKSSVLNFREGVTSVANASEIGEYYQYTVKHKVSLPRQKSAMLPIIDQAIQATKVSIYNEATHLKYPLLGLRLKNTAGQPLNQGPITVYEEGTYVGETRILDLNAKEERLLSYALDQSVEIKSEVKSTVSPDMTLRIGDANLTANYSMRQTRTYTIANRASKDRLVLLEHAIRADWKLVEPKKPLETARDVVRFEVKVPAGKTVTFDVVEDQARSEPLALGSEPTPLPHIAVTVKALSHMGEDKLLALKIFKGLLLPTLKTRESRTYFIQNNSDIARTFTVDHIIRAGWVRLNDQGEPQRGPDVVRFELSVAKGKTVSREVREERTFQPKGELLRNLSTEKAHEYRASPVPSADVKAALTKVLTMNAKIADLSKDLAEREGQFKQLTDDQARLRETLKVVQPSAEPYKKFLDKYVSLENEIEAMQKQIRQLQTSLLQQQRSLATYVAALTAE